MPDKNFGLGVGSLQQDGCGQVGLRCGEEGELGGGST